MRCYIWGTNNLEERDHKGRGVACFAIPDWGIQFRAAHEGTAGECEYGALLSLLRFVENNPKVFENQKLDLFTDSAGIVEQVHGRLPVAAEVAKSWAQIRSLRLRIPFQLSWVPPHQNRAIDGVIDLAPLKGTISIPNPKNPSDAHHGSDLKL